MAFSVSNKVETVMGNKRIVYGIYSSTGGSAGGDIETGLQSIECVQLQTEGLSVISAPVVSQTLPRTSGSVTIATNVDETGSFFIIGE